MSWSRRRARTRGSSSASWGPVRSGMERFDAFVIGGGGTGSEVAFSLARTSGLRVAIAERDRLGGECSHYGCVPTKVMLRSRRSRRSLGTPSGSASGSPRSASIFGAVQQRARDVIASQSGEGASRSNASGSACSCRRRASSASIGWSSRTARRSRRKGWCSPPARKQPSRRSPGCRRPVLDESRGDLGTDGATRVAGGDRCRSDRDRVRADLREVRVAA